MHLLTDGRHADRYIPRTYLSGDKKNQGLRQLHFHALYVQMSQQTCVLSIAGKINCNKIQKFSRI